MSPHHISQMAVATAVLLLLAGCGGMNRAVGVLPNTMDDLGRKSEALRGEDRKPAIEAPGRAPSGIEGGSIAR